MSRYNTIVFFYLTGVLYHRWGKHEQAGKYYRKALKLDPRSENVHDNLKKLKRTTRQLSSDSPK